MTAYLARVSDWFDYLENYRNALAHRIPLYIPPKQINQAEMDETQRLNDEIALAYRERRIHDLAGIRARQAALGHFEPVIMHSYGEGARPIRFHVQMLADYATVVEFAENVTAEVDGLT